MPTLQISDGNQNTIAVKCASGTGTSGSPLLASRDLNSVGGAQGQQAKANSLSATLATDDPTLLVAGATSGAGVIADAVGTLQQYLRGLVKLFNAGLQVLDVAGTNKIAVNASGQVGAAASNRRQIATNSFTRPSNTTTYSVGQVVADSTTSGTARTFACGRVTGGSGIIVSCQITDSAAAALPPVFYLWLFTATPSVLNDAATWAPNSTDLGNLVTVLTVGNFTKANANGALAATEINRPFVCAGGDTNLYGVLVAGDAYIPLSGETFGLSLGVLQD